MLSLPGLLKILQLDFKQLWTVNASMLRHVQENLVWRIALCLEMKRFHFKHPFNFEVLMV
jgi:hypothetical protein